MKDIHRLQLEEISVIRGLLAEQRALLAEQGRTLDIVAANLEAMRAAKAHRRRGDRE